MMGVAGLALGDALRSCTCKPRRLPRHPGTQQPLNPPCPGSPCSPAPRPRSPAAARSRRRPWRAPRRVPATGAAAAPRRPTQIACRWPRQRSLQGEGAGGAGQQRCVPCMHALACWLRRPACALAPAAAPRRAAIRRRAATHRGCRCASPSGHSWARMWPGSPRPPSSLHLMGQNVCPVKRCLAASHAGAGLSGTLGSRLPPARRHAGSPVLEKQSRPLKTHRARCQSPTPPAPRCATAG